MPPKPPQDRKPGKKSSRGPSRTPKKSGKGKRPSDWRLYLLLLGATVLMIGLVLLARREEQLPPPAPDRPAESRSDAAAPAREQVEAFLALAAVPAEAIRREPAAAPRNYHVEQRLPEPRLIEQLRQGLHGLDPPLTLAVPEDGVLAIAGRKGENLVVIHFLPPPVPAPRGVPAPGQHGRVAIIVDDLGRGTHAARQLLAIGQPLTFAVLPGEAHAAKVAELAHAAGIEVILHAPMEPQGFPVIDPGEDALLVGQTDAQLREQLLALLRRVPHAAGANNHMGSRFTEDERAMAVVMAVLQERGLFFVDSLTTSRSVGAGAAAAAGVSLARREVFLDNITEVDAIVKELRQLAKKARRNGGAVGICHPYPETLQALRQELPRLAAEGIEFVPVSALVKGGG
jgi:uncharacterized protein